MDFLVTRGTGAYLISVWRDGTRTRTGIKLGDPLQSARRRYPNLRCGIRNERSEYEPYPYCRIRLGALNVWFGQAPIRSITVASTGLG
jgi:hypothetical protein